MNSDSNAQWQQIIDGGSLKLSTVEHRTQLVNVNGRMCCDRQSRNEILSANKLTSMRN